MTNTNQPSATEFDRLIAESRSSNNVMLWLAMTGLFLSTIGFLLLMF